MSLRWDSDKVEITLPAPGGAGEHTQQLTHEEIALLTNYEAHALTLPAHMEAVLVLTIDGRIDMPDFTLQHLIEPFNHMHPWVSYRRMGALLFVGERMTRLNLQQLRVLEAIETIEAAGDDVAARLRAWPKLMDALHMPGKHHVLVQGDMPYLRIQQGQVFPNNALTRAGRDVRPAQADATWAMQPGRRYYVH